MNTLQCTGAAIFCGGETQRRRVRARRRTARHGMFRAEKFSPRRWKLRRANEAPKTKVRERRSPRRPRLGGAPTRSTPDGSHVQPSPDSLLRRLVPIFPGPSDVIRNLRWSCARPSQASEGDGAPPSLIKPSPPPEPQIVVSPHTPSPLTTSSTLRCRRSRSSTTLVPTPTTTTVVS